MGKLSIAVDICRRILIYKTSSVLYNKVISKFAEISSKFSKDTMLL